MKPVVYNRKGSSMVTVLIAMGILSAATYTGMLVAQNITQTNESGDLRDQADAEAFVANANLTDVNNCTANLRGFMVDPSGDEKVFDLNNGELMMAQPDSLNLSNRYLVPVQDPRSTSRLNLRRVQVRVDRDSANIAYVMLDFGVKEKILGGAMKAREVPIILEFDPNNDRRIHRCASGSLPPENPDDIGRSQGTVPCGDPPREITNQQGLPTRGGQPVNIAAADVEDELARICRDQRYPVTQGIVIRRADINDCFDNQGRARNARCQARLDLAFGETLRGIPKTVDGPVVLKNRRGYGSVAECREQRAYSEGDVVYREGTEGGKHTKNNGQEITVHAPSSKRYVCTAGHWTLLESYAAEYEVYDPVAATISSHDGRGGESSAPSGVSGTSGGANAGAPSGGSTGVGGTGTSGTGGTGVGSTGI